MSLLDKIIDNFFAATTNLFSFQQHMSAVAVFFCNNNLDIMNCNAFYDFIHVAKNFIHCTKHLTTYSEKTSFK